MPTGPVSRWRKQVLASWVLVLPVAPVAVAALVLQFFGPGPDTAPLTDPVAMEAATIPLSSGPLVYATAVVVHVVLSGLAIASYAVIIRDADRPSERKLAVS